MFSSRLESRGAKRSTLQFARLLESFFLKTTGGKICGRSSSLQDIPDLKDRILDHIKMETPHSLPIAEIVAADVFDESLAALLILQL